jgi:AcrR family transcriptional regulator
VADMTGKVSLREKHAVETRQRIVEAGIGLFVANGFELTTIDEIAERADVSARTFFRYFPSKDSLLFHDFDERMNQMADLIRRRPVDEPPVETFVHVLTEMVEQVRSTPEERALVIRLVSERPSLRSYQRETIAGHGERLATAILAERAGVPAHDLGLRAMVASVSACFDVALQAWIAEGAEGPFRPRFEEVLAAGSSALSSWVPSAR